MNIGDSLGAMLGLAFTLFAVVVVTFTAIGYIGVGVLLGMIVAIFGTFGIVEKEHDMKNWWWDNMTKSGREWSKRKAKEAMRE